MLSSSGSSARAEGSTPFAHQEWLQAEVSRRVQRDMLAGVMVKLYAIMESDDIKPSEKLKAVQIISKLAGTSKTKARLLVDRL